MILYALLMRGVFSMETTKNSNCIHSQVLCRKSEASK